MVGIELDRPLRSLSEKQQTSELEQRYEPGKEEEKTSIYFRVEVARIWRLAVVINSVENDQSKLTLMFWPDS